VLVRDDDDMVLADWQLLSVQRSVGAYYERFKLLLNPSNAQHLQQLLHVAAALHSCLQGAGSNCSNSNGNGNGTGTGGRPAAKGVVVGRVMAVNDMLFDLGLDSMNMFDLARWVKVNKIAFKVGYVPWASGQRPDAAAQQQHCSSHLDTPPL
jgi:hypothetical protein